MLPDSCSIKSGLVLHNYGPLTFAGGQGDPDIYPDLVPPPAQLPMKSYVLARLCLREFEIEMLNRRFIVL